MLENCFECSELMFDGFSYCCSCKGCPIWNTDLEPIIIDAPNEDFEKEEFLDDDLFI